MSKDSITSTLPENIKRYFQRGAEFYVGLFEGDAQQIVRSFFEDPEKLAFFCQGIADGYQQTNPRHCSAAYFIGRYTSRIKGKIEQREQIRYTFRGFDGDSFHPFDEKTIGGWVVGSTARDISKKLEDDKQDAA